MACQRTLSILVVFLAYATCQTSKDNLVAISQKARKLPYDICGRSDIFQDKLYSGSAAALGAYPWMAALGYNKNGSKELSWMAAGSLITEQYVLTVAHALAPNLPAIFKLAVVRLGDLNLDDSVSDGASPVDMKAEKAIPHPQYDAHKRTNDIGLIKLESKVQFDYLKKPICLPSPEFHETSFVGRSTIIIGWGRSEQGRASAPLAETSVDIQDFDRCKTNYEKRFPQTIMDERVFCASSPGSDACSGDTGGPLMMYRRYRGKARMFVMGIVSYGYNCALEEYPGVYTNVSSFMYWIVDNLEL